MKKYIIFDLDGTLIESMGNTNNIIESILREKLPDTDMELAKYIFNTTAGTPVSKQLELIYEGKNVNYIEITKIIYDKLLSLNSSFFPGVLDKIKLLKDDYKLFLTTGNSTKAAYKHLNNGGILDYFDVILGSDEIHKGPNHLEIFAEYTGDIDFYSKSIYVGDGDSDREFAKSKGIDFIHIGNNKKDLYEIESVIYIENILNLFKKNMKIAIGTLKTPKVEGVKEAVKNCPYFKDIFVEYILESVPSDISDMPLSFEETMAGAKNRAQNIKKKGTQADFYVGIEGGTTDIGGKKYIGGIIYIENNLGEGHFGFSPMIEVPKLVEKKLYEEKLELGPVMSELSGITNIQSQDGSMSAWSDDMFTRKDEFELTFKAAICPFYNKFYKLN